MLGGGAARAGLGRLTRQDSAPRPNHLLRTAREDRGWTQPEAAHRLQQMAMQLGETEPGIEGNAISRWERGTHEPGPRYVRLLSLLYDRRPADLGLSDTGVKKSDQRSAATIELIQRSQASDLDPSAAETIDGAVDRLC